MNKTVFLTRNRRLNTTEDTESTEISRTNNTSVCGKLISLPPLILSSVSSVFSVVKKSLGLFLSGLAWLAFCSPMLAADPLVEVPKMGFSCDVDVAQRNAPTREVRKKVTIVQTGNMRADITHWSDGSTSQLWTQVDKNISVMENNRWNKDILVLRGAYRDGCWPRMLRFDTESLGWITPAAFSKVGSSAGELHYKAMVKVNDTAEGEPLPVLYQAWIDAKTLLPTKLDDGYALYTLKFSDAPARPLVMPDNMQAKLKSYQAILAPHPHL